MIQNGNTIVVFHGIFPPLEVFLKTWAEFDFSGFTLVSCPEI
jgi:hypothetical protein